MRAVQSGNSTLAAVGGPDGDEFVLHPAQLLGRAIDDLGAVAAVKRQLQTDTEQEATLDLAASNRLDLTVEFLALCPAWESLFDELERRTAAERLLNLVSLLSSDGAVPSPGDDLGCIVDWLVEKIARWEVDGDLPKSRVKYAWQYPSQRTEQSWCDSIAETAGGFSETGLIVTSLTQCTHYMQCRQCIGAFPELKKQFRRFETTITGQCHELLKLLGVCLDRALQTRKHGAPVGCDDEFAWRAIICGAGLTYFDSIQEFSRILREAVHGRTLEPALHRVLNLNQDEIHLLAFVETASWPFIEMQWSLYDNDELVYLPSDGDIWDITGAVVILNAPEVGEWKRLMTGSDLAFLRRARGGGESTQSLDGDGLLLLIDSAAVLQGQKWTSALRPPESPREHSDIEPPCLRRIESANASALGSRWDGIAETLLDGMAELRDLVASNSAAQVPIIDTLQSIRSKIDGPSRYTAEVSLRLELGDALYDKLGPLARHFAISAEYHWLDSNGPNPSSIVLCLATAFEAQAREAIFNRFCHALLSRGICNYPELPAATALSPIESTAFQRPRPGLPIARANVSKGSEIPKLLENGKIWSLNLRKMQQLLEHPLPMFSKFLAQQRIQLTAVNQVLPEITRARNSAAHRGEPLLRKDASDIRRRWLGKTKDFPNIFTVLMAGDSSGRGAEVWP